MKRVIQSEDWLPLLLRMFDLFIRPSPSNILRSFEHWEYETIIRPQLRRLQRARFLEQRGEGRGRTLRFTPQGRIAALGGVDPVQRWRRRWDGRLRLLMFDLSSRKQALRIRVWRWLRSRRLGYLQNSVWLSPDPISDETLPLKRLDLTPESFLVFEGTPAGKVEQIEVVLGAWDFPRINGYYEQVCQIAEEGLDLAISGGAPASELRRWLIRDCEAWRQVVVIDPFLPEPLLPADYLGRIAWHRRNSALDAMARLGVGVQIV